MDLMPIPFGVSSTLAPRAKVLRVQDDVRPPELDARHYLRTLRRRKWLVIAGVLLGVAGATLQTATQVRVYDSSALLLIEDKTANTGSVFSQSNAIQNPTLVVQTQIQIITSKPVRDAVLSKVGFAAGSTPIGVSEVGQTDVVRVTASSPNAQRAAAVADAYSNAYIDFTRTQDIDSDVAAATQIQSKIDDLAKQISGIDDQVAVAQAANRQVDVANLRPQRDNLVAQQGLLQQRLDQLQVDSSLRTGAAELVTAATAPSAPSSPKPARNVLLGFIVGLMLGIGASYIVEYFDDSIPSVEEASVVTEGLPNLGVIPRIIGWKDASKPYVVSIEEPTSHTAETYRTLRTSLQFVGLDRAAKVIQISSPNAEEGKTTTLANLGVTLANAGQRVCMCCCDLRRPRIHSFFGLENDLGLTSAILGEKSVSEAVQKVPGVDGLYLMASGPLPTNPSEMLASTRAAEVVGALSALYDVVLIDSPPVLPVTDATVLSRVADATLLILSLGVTTRRAVTRSLQVLRQVGAPIIGVVLNGTSADTDAGYYKYYGRGGYRQNGPYENGNAPRAVPVEDAKQH